jgi:hypothetical protein
VPMKIKRSGMMIKCSCGASIYSVMAGLVPAIHVLSSGTKTVDARDRPGHDDG